MLKTMTIYELFKVGKSFETAIGEGSKNERDIITDYYYNLNLSENTISTINNINKEINFLISGEVWCTDFQINATALKKICDFNKKFNISVISYFRGLEFLTSHLNINQEFFRCPTIAILDKDFNIIGKFEEMPQVVRLNQDFKSIESDYLNGKYLLDTVDELLNIIIFN